MTQERRAQLTNVALAPTPLHTAHDRERFGGKAAQLACALDAGLPVPAGVALCSETTELIVDGDQTAIAALSRLLEPLAQRPLAVRSSALDEDHESGSFAGQHATHLGVDGAQMLEAVRNVHASARTASALAYRDHLGLEGPVRMAVVIQTMVRADCAGVMFSRDPVTGADERVVEASFGLGEVVVSGEVTPDQYRMRRGGEVVERRLGEKDVEVVLQRNGRTTTRPVSKRRQGQFCLDGAQLQALDRLATACDPVFDGHHDIEWAFEESALFLLQRRPITR